MVKVLKDIVTSVRGRLLEQKKQMSMAECMIKAQSKQLGKCLSIELARAQLGIIAEIKYSSPSEGVIRSDLDPVGVASSYLQAGAAALSILTEQDHFNGSLDYLSDVRKKFPEAFLLRKDFIIESYQVAQSAAFGADTFLLIAALLDPTQLSELIEQGRGLGMEPLVEVHDENELNQVLSAGAKLIGINSRNLTTMQVDLSVCRALINYKPKGSGESRVFVAESGLQKLASVLELKALGFDGFLVGTYFMKTENPGEALSQWLSQG